jgi:hypothetical protein
VFQVGQPGIWPAAACGRDSGLALLRAGNDMRWAREVGRTVGGVWRAGGAGMRQLKLLTGQPRPQGLSISISGVVGRGVGQPEPCR